LQLQCRRFESNRIESRFFAEPEKREPALCERGNRQRRKLVTRSPSSRLSNQRYGVPVSAAEQVPHLRARDWGRCASLSSARLGMARREGGSQFEKSRMKPLCAPKVRHPEARQASPRFLQRASRTEGPCADG